MKPQLLIVEKSSNLFRVEFDNGFVAAGDFYYYYKTGKVSISWWGEVYSEMVQLEDIIKEVILNQEEIHLIYRLN